MKYSTAGGSLCPYVTAVYELSVCGKIGGRLILYSRAKLNIREIPIQGPKSVQFSKSSDGSRIAISTFRFCAPLRLVCSAFAGEDRASASGAPGWGFNSLRARHCSVLPMSQAAHVFDF